MRGLPLLPIQRVAATLLCVATHPDKRTSGLPWTMPDAGHVFRLKTGVINEGVYAEMNRRARQLSWRQAKPFTGGPPSLAKL